MTTAGIAGIAVGLSMDAFAVSVSSGCSLRRVGFRHVFTIAFAFGFFQAAMPILGWNAGNLFRNFIVSVDHWIAFGILSFVGGKMIVDGLHPEKGCPDEEEHEIMNPVRLLALAVATSLDALATGLSFSFIGTPILAPAAAIGTVTFALCMIGVKAGNRLHTLTEGKVEVLGGAVIVLIGIGILYQHLST